MATTEELDSFFIKMGLPYDQVGEGTWVLHPEGEHRASIGVAIEEPIVLFSVPMFEVQPQTEKPEHLFRALLELNAELMHSAYALQGDQIVLSGAHQLENLDFNEFQAMVEDMCMALDNHIEKIASLVHARAVNGAAAAAGRSV